MLQESSDEKPPIKILSIIGTRPQYIKIKPFYDFCKRQGVNHQIVDTLQHYSNNVSQLLINDLGLKIDFPLTIKSDSEISFLSDSILKIENILKIEKPDFVLVYGDTNSTFCASLVSYKMGIPVGHVEANLRCGDVSVPEEVNRIFVDTVSQLRFCSTRDSVFGQGDIFCGDLEYELLNNLNPNIEFQDYGVMTIHRQSNLNFERLRRILEFCGKASIIIKFFVHHRTQPLLKKIMIPKNIKIYESCSYSEMVKNLAECKFVITDSGGINKIAPFFGKKTLIMRERIEWTETREKGFVRTSQLLNEELDWLSQSPKQRDKRFYLGIENPSYTMYSNIEKYLERGW